MSKLMDLLERGHFEFTSDFHANRAIRCSHLFRDLGLFEEECINLARKVPEEMWKNVAVLAAATYCGQMMAYHIGRWLAVSPPVPDRRMAVFSLERGEPALVSDDPLRAGEHAIIVFENALTGSRIQRLSEHLRASGVVVDGILVLVDRRQDQTAAIDGTPVTAFYDLSRQGYNGRPENCPDCREGKPLTRRHRLL